MRLANNCMLSKYLTLTQSENEHCLANNICVLHYDWEFVLAASSKRRQVFILVSKDWADLHVGASSFLF